MGTPLSQLTTIGVGGVPAELVECRWRDDLIEHTLGVWRTGEPWLILGGGSNLVVADEVPELHVIRVANKGIEKLGDGHVRVQAGETWDDLVELAVNSGWGGIESLSGIPGTVGAAPVQNIGAYGQEVAGVITRVEFVDYATHETVILTKDQLGFGYRDSIFKRGRTGLITWVEFQFVTDLPAGSTALMQQRRAEVLEQRAAKGMVLNPADADTRSCGSFFMNPIVPDRVARTLPFEAPRWETAEDDGLTVKLSAAWLIENAGVPKGFRIAGSGAGLSTKHCLAITNRGGATAYDVLQLKTFVQERVAARWGIQLVPEPNLIGFDRELD
ncbi:MAG: UDP-N-acetylmuramate dehydrogenase [Actinomycetales bacterium]|nr:UDP-N-acetylmuramate dehydrogenase [Actinomycetales bacterium]